MYDSICLYNRICSWERWGFDPLDLTFSPQTSPHLCCVWISNITSRNLVQRVTCFRRREVSGQMDLLRFKVAHLVNLWVSWICWESVIRSLSFLFYLPNVLIVSTKNVELWPVLVDASGIFCGSIVQIQGLEDAYEDSLMILFPNDSCQGWLGIGSVGDWSGSRSYAIRILTWPFPDWPKQIWRVSDIICEITINHTWI